MAWFILIVAGIFEIGWAIGLKYCDGFTRPVPSLLTVGCMAVSFGCLSLALRSLPLGVAYAVWTGVGTVGTALFGMVVLGEGFDLRRALCVGLIVLGIAGLKLIAVES